METKNAVVCVLVEDNDLSTISKVLSMRFKNGQTWSIQRSFGSSLYSIKTVSKFLFVSFFFFSLAVRFIPLVLIYGRNHQ